MPALVLCNVGVIFALVESIYSIAILPSCSNAIEYIEFTGAISKCFFIGDIEPGKPVNAYFASKAVDSFCLGFSDQCSVDFDSPPPVCSLC
jgi:hypothetical protein